VRRPARLHLNLMAFVTYRTDPSGCRFWYNVEGDGAPVIFIQGVGVHGRGWTPQVQELRSHFRCLIFDNRGMGESQPAAVPITVEQMARDSFWLMNELGWDSAHVVGHSLGGPVALQMSLESPERVRSLSLLCTVARGRDATRVSWPLLSLGVRGRIGTRRSRRRAFLSIVMAQSELDRVDRDELAAELEPLFGHDLAIQPPVAMKQLAALRRYDASDRLSRLAGVPTLVMSASHDPIAPPRFGRAVAAGISAARFIEFDDASHGLPILHAGRVNQLLRDHWDRAESVRAVGRIPAT
jgi:3-oxoadipate enol-lactonase